MGGARSSVANSFMLSGLLPTRAKSPEKNFGRNPQEETARGKPYLRFAHAQQSAVARLFVVEHLDCAITAREQHLIDFRVPRNAYDGRVLAM